MDDLDVQKAKDKIIKKNAVLHFFDGTSQSQIVFSVTDIENENIVSTQLLGKILIFVSEKINAVARITSDVKFDEVIAKNNRKYISWNTWYAVVLAEFKRRAKVIMEKENTAKLKELEERELQNAKAKYDAMTPEQKQQFLDAEAKAIADEKAKLQSAVIVDDTDY